MKKELLIIIPVYNEEEAIGSLLDEIRAIGIEEHGDILVINDGSTDDTQRIVEEKQVDIINKPFNLGYGSTLQLGYKYATDKEYQYIIQIDGDGQHDLSNIKVVYDALTREYDQPDIVIGSRFLSDENEMETTFLKNVAIGLFRKVIRFFTKQEITDPTSGLQGLNRSAFSFYSKYGNFDYQYPDINMIIQMLLKGYKIEEVPAHMYERESGESMHSGILKPIKYMILISLSTVSILIRQRDGYVKLCKEKRKRAGRNEVKEKHLSVRRYSILTSIIVLLLVMMFFIMDVESFVRVKEVALGEAQQFSFQEKDFADFVNQENIPEDVLMIEGNELQTAEDAAQLKKLVEEQKTLVFLNLPTADYIEQYDLTEILGIRKVFGEQTQKELTLVPGFMLGGLHQFEDLVYDALELDLSFSTKVYAYGKKTPSKEYPIIWRNTYDNTEIYAVNGPFMETRASYGIVAAILAEIEEDYLYPVINTRLMVYESFPYVSDINKKQLEKNYNRDAMKLQHDILIPDLLSINKLRGFVPNGFFRLGFAEGELRPVGPNDERQLLTYKEQLFKDGGEVGLRYSGDIEQDLNDYRALFEDELATAVFIGDETTDAEIDAVLAASDSIQTIIGPFQKEKNYQYLEGDAIYLPIMNEGFVQSGQEELDFVSMVTAFGSIVQSLDLEEIVDPADGKEKWTGGQKAYVEFIDRYRQQFSFLENRNITDTNLAIKALLNNEPAINKSPDRIEIIFPTWHGETSYILRTSKQVTGVENGTFKKIEENAYLITAKGQQVEVKVVER